MADPPKPFDMVRAVFFLLAVIMLIEVVASVAAGAMCWWINITQVRQPGACIQVGTMIRELWSELITAVLALLLAARPPTGGRGE